MTSHSIGRRHSMAWLLVAPTLTLILALSACGRGGLNGNRGDQGGGLTQSGSDVVQMDSDLTAIIATLDSASLDTQIDQSNLDAEQQPVALAANAQTFEVAAAPHETMCGDLTCVKTFGDTQITKRIASLEEAKTKINGVVSKGHLTSAQAQPLLDQIAMNESGLNTLKTKLDVETDLGAARTDVKNIYLQFRIYAVFLPRARHVVALDVMTNVDQKMKDAEGKIQEAIAKAPDSQKDQLNKLFDDYKAQLKEAEAQLDAAQGQLPVLTPNIFNIDRATYDKAFAALKADTQAAHNALKKAREDLHQIATILKGDKAPKGTPISGSPTAA